MHQLQHVDAHVYDRLRGKPGPLATVEDGVRSLAVVLAAEQSARTGERVLVASIG